MATQIKTNIVINAPIDTVWNVLTDFNKYSEWNSFIPSLTGNVKADEKITVNIVLPGSKGMTLKPRVLKYEENKELKWLGHLLFKGLFDGEHRFELIDNGDKTTTFIQSEKFRGILVPFFKKMLNVKTVNGFNQMNKELKKRCER